MGPHIHECVVSLCSLRSCSDDPDSPDTLSLPFRFFPRDFRGRSIPSSLFPDRTHPLGFTNSTRFPKCVFGEMLSSLVHRRLHSLDLKLNPTPPTGVDLFLVLCTVVGEFCTLITRRFSVQLSGSGLLLKFSIRSFFSAATGKYSPTH